MRAISRIFYRILWLLISYAFSNMLNIFGKCWVTFFRKNFVYDFIQSPSKSGTRKDFSLPLATKTISESNWAKMRYENLVSLFQNGRQGKKVDRPKRFKILSTRIFLEKYFPLFLEMGYFFWEELGQVLSIFFLASFILLMVF